MDWWITWGYPAVLVVGALIFFFLVVVVITTWRDRPTPKPTEPGTSPEGVPSLFEAVPEADDPPKG